MCISALPWHGLMQAQARLAGHRHAKARGPAPCCSPTTQAVAGMQPVGPLSLWPPQPQGSGEYHMDNGDDLHSRPQHNQQTTYYTHLPTDSPARHRFTTLTTTTTNFTTRHHTTTSTTTTTTTAQTSSTAAAGRGGTGGRPCPQRNGIELMQLHTVEHRAAQAHPGAAAPVLSCRKGSDLRRAPAGARWCIILGQNLPRLGPSPTAEEPASAHAP